VFLAVLYVACLSLALVTGVWIFVRWRQRPSLERWIAASWPFLGVIFTWIVVQAILESPYRHWNANRVSPTVSVLAGYSLYYGETSGPVTGNVYTPLGTLAYLPAALASTPRAIMAIGTMLSLVFYFGPVVWLYLRLRSPEQARLKTMAQFYTLALCPLVTFNLIDSLGYSATFIHSDAPALGLAGAACVILYAYPEYRWKSLAVSAFCAVLSVWSKQITVPILAALPLWLLLTAGWKVAGRYLAWLVGAGLAAAGLFLTIFDPANFFFNAVVIPGNCPWTGDSPYKIARLARAALELENQGFVLAILLAFGGLLLWIDRSMRTGSLRAWLADNRWTLFVTAGLTVIPTVLLGRLKVGGDLNAMSFVLYFLLIGLCVMLHEGEIAPKAEWVQLGFRLLTVVVITASAIVLVQSQCQRMVNRDFSRPIETDVVCAFLRQHPGEVYFPWNPLAHVLVEGRFYHFEYGMYDRGLARHPISDEHFRRHLPPRLSLVCIPKEFVDQCKYAMGHLKEFTRRVDIPELPGFLCLEREEQVASHRQGASGPVN
jgi:hypothetical protein